MTEHFVGQITMKMIECCNCHMSFAVTEEFYDECQKEKPNKSFYCPNGHGQHFVGISNEEVLKRRLKNVQECCDTYRDRVIVLEETIPRMRGGYRAQLKRAKNK